MPNNVFFETCDGYVASIKTAYDAKDHKKVEAEVVWASRFLINLLASSSIGMEIFSSQMYRLLKAAGW